MATVARRSDYSLESDLYQETYEFEFSQAIRILEGLNQNSISFGEGDDPLKEALQVKSRLTLAVSSSDIYSVTAPLGGDHRPILTVNFLGLAGIQGPLPTPYTDLVIDRVRHKDTSSRDFLDIFNHRLASFWHRVRKKVVLGMEQIPPESTVAGKTFLDLLGLNSHYLRHKLRVPDRSLLTFAPLFWQRTKSTAGLQQLLKSYFQTEIHIQELQGHWRQGALEDLSLMGTQKGQYNVLGKSVILGKRSWDQAAGIRIFLKQLSWKKYLTHLPGQHGHAALASLTKFYGGIDHKFTFYAAIKREEIPPTLLGKVARLGQITWLTRGKGQGFDNNPVMRLSYDSEFTLRA
ncbi:type VI secretion system baseplate subunit TssG [Candidatus Paracaedibacter symbiosus]|uniref:type VI secretion system baseplate subunit TssG n=1 Tax=Candidatus Paracaedibacter symbiosus TaxID=244582 RepID=UPI000509B5D1|nr:type VI secretion system baseplate subunit TssG [Candidatus Paracaedibacter symbiosus]